jgi:hypothetical protein
MKIVGRIATALALVVLGACSDGAPTTPEAPEMTEARFVELREAALRIAGRIEAAGVITAADRIEIDALQRELDECIDRVDGPAPALSAESGATVVAAAPTSPDPSAPCTPCPLIISNGNCIGVLRSSGPCRPGAGLERCFYNWYCYSTQTG